MKRMKVTGKELALLCGIAALGTLTFPLGAAARTSRQCYCHCWQYGRNRLQW